jgi:CheY-like chemotaxis protein
MKESSRSLCLIHTIILADDDADDCMIFKEVVRDCVPDAKLYIVTDGFALMSLLESYMPDIVFVDLDMPYKNGLQCIKEIRDNPAFTNLPIVVISSTDRLDNITTAYDLGAHLVIRKASSYEVVCDSITSALYLDWSNPEAIKQAQIKAGSFVPFK